jgi:hypothetical protein
MTMKNTDKISVAGITKKELAELRREWDGWEVVDATENLRLFVSVEDVKTATRGDLSCCALANCCKRSFGSTKLKFGVSVCYVELPAAGRVERYTLPEKARKFIENFDLANPVASQEITLCVPRPSERLNSQLKQKRSRRAAEKKRQHAKGGTQPPRRNSVARKNGLIRSDGVRNASGQANFTLGSAVGQEAAE